MRAPCSSFGVTVAAIEVEALRAGNQAGKMICVPAECLDQLIAVEDFLLTEVVDDVVL
jgi:hypothetical protein